MSKGTKIKQHAHALSKNETPEILDPRILACRYLLRLSLVLIVLEILMPMDIAPRIALFLVIILLLIALCICAHFARSNDALLKDLRYKRSRLMNDYDSFVARREELLAGLSRPQNHYAIEQATLISEIEELAGRKTRLEASELQQSKIREARIIRMMEMSESRKRALIDLEQIEISELEKEVCERIDKMLEEVRKLESGQELDLASELLKKQHESIETFLKDYRIIDSPIIGITDADKSKFQLLGLVTALDVNDSSLQGLGLEQSKIKALLRWRNYLHDQAEIQKPTIVASSTRKKIRKRYEKPRQKIESEIDALNTRMRRDVHEIKALYVIARAQLLEIENDLSDGSLSIAESETQFARHLRELELKTRQAYDKLQQLKADDSSRENKSRKDLEQTELKALRIKNQIDNLAMPSQFEYLKFLFGFGKRTTHARNRGERN